MQYEIVGEPYPAVICHLQRGEQMKTEYLQTMPLSTLVDIIAAHIPTSSS